MTKIIDLTFDINLKNPNWKLEMPYNVGDPEWKAEMPEGYFKVIPWVYGLDNTLVEYITMWSHVGTHIESPYHQESGRPTIGEIPIESLVGEGVILDLTPTIKEGDYLTHETEEEIKNRYGLPGPLLTEKHFLTLYKTSNRKKSINKWKGRRMVNK